MKQLKSDGTGIYMMATTAIHKLGDISRDKPDLCIVFKEDEENFYGNFVEGFGFIHVRFPKKTTRPLTDKEKEEWNGKIMAINGTAVYKINID